MGNDGNNSEPRFGDADSKGKEAVDEYAGHVPVHASRPLRTTLASNG
jgi:hypothetical protein